MSDDSNGTPCTPGQEFVIPGTHDTACGDDGDLSNCVHCGASLSPGSEFCHVCATAVSGGETPAEHDHDHAHDHAE